MNHSFHAFSKPLLCGFAALTLAGLTVPASADPVNISIRQVAALNASVADAQRSFERIAHAFQAGGATSAEVSHAAIMLAEAQIGFAVAHNQPKDAQANLEAIVTERAKLMAGSQAFYRFGINTMTEVRKDEAALALARARAALFTLATIREQELAGVQERVLVGVATPQEKETATKALQEAQRLFEESGR